mmetsp:Transcript_61046/g.186312  ORF Transcript_61046/g.186312 Transcript_61046/m.186312 type:complete len:221 (+) Transcript_61046:1522-2184(+)
MSCFCPACSACAGVADFALAWCPRASARSACGMPIRRPPTPVACGWSSSGGSSRTAATLRCGPRLLAPGGRCVQLQQTHLLEMRRFGSSSTVWRASGFTPATTAPPRASPLFALAAMSCTTACIGRTRTWSSRMAGSRATTVGSWTWQLLATTSSRGSDPARQTSSGRASRRLRATTSGMLSCGCRTRATSDKSSASPTRGCVFSSSTAFLMSSPASWSL